MNKVWVKVNSVLYGGWKSVTITRSLEAAASTFAMDISEKYPSTGEQLTLKPGDKVQILIDNKTGEDLVVTGVIDKVEISYSGTDHTRKISGRSLTSKIIDSSPKVKTTQFKNMTVLDIAKSLCGPFGVDVVLAPNTDQGAAVPVFTLEQDEKAFDVIERLCWSRKLIVTDDAEGRVVLFSSTAERNSSGLQHVSGAKNNNILSASLTADDTNRFQFVTIRAQQKGDDEEFGESKNQISYTAEDTRCKNGKQLTKNLSGEGGLSDCKAQAEWEVSARRGESQIWNITVQGWRQENDALWQLGLIQVNDDFMNTSNDLVVTSITYSLDSAGTKTQMTIKSKEALEVDPAKLKPKKDKKGEDDGDDGIYAQVRKDVQGK
ncbi:phage baseplate assembly protein [Novispirillum itersonii]|uniref:phage baseplate assembly protein n=1 Tax=Novispirillum itersonii TaxID=189 RepID=UPI0012DEA937|nr:hypothetical protein [Novispirillum itersonii]